MAGTSASIIGIMVGIGIGFWWATKKLKKQQQNIPTENLNEIKEKEVKHGTEKENNQEESRKGIFKFFRRKPKREEEPRGFIQGDGTTPPRESIVKQSNIDSGTTDSIGEQSDISIQPSTKSKGTKPKLRKSKPNSKKRWTDFD